MPFIDPRSRSTEWRGQGKKRRQVFGDAIGAHCPATARPPCGCRRGYVQVFRWHTSRRRCPGAGNRPDPLRGFMWAAVQCRTWRRAGWTRCADLLDLTSKQRVGVDGYRSTHERRQPIAVRVPTCAEDREGRSLPPRRQGGYDELCRPTPWPPTPGVLVPWRRRRRDQANGFFAGCSARGCGVVAADDQGRPGVLNLTIPRFGCSDTPPQGR